MKDLRPSKRLKVDERDCMRTMDELIRMNESFLSLERQLRGSKAHSLYWKMKEAADRLLGEYRDEMERLGDAAGEFLHKLDDRKHDEDTVEKVIDAFPEALRYAPYEAIVPVQKLLGFTVHGISFVPLLAQEGSRRKLFPKEERGGLFHGDFEYVLHEFLIEDGAELLREKIGPTEYCRRVEEEKCKLQKEVHSMGHDEKCKMILQKLVELNVLQKKDIFDHDMAYHSAFECSRKRFDYLVSVCPEALTKFDESEQDRLPIQKKAANGSIHGFGMLLNAGLKYYPKEVGFLFHKDSSRKRTMDLTMKQFSCKDIFKCIHLCIPPSDDYPIIHDVLRLAPKYFPTFWKYYPDAVYLRNKKGRLPLHIALKSSLKFSHTLLALVNCNAPTNLHEKDPVNGLYPFMSAASGNRSDLDVIYYLLRRDPDVCGVFQKISREELGDSCQKKYAPVTS